MKITVEDENRAFITAQGRGPLIQLSHDLPGRRKWKGDTLYVELSVPNIEYITRNFPAAEWSDPAPIARAERLKQEAMQASTVRTTPAEADAFAYKTPPFAHQRKAFLASRDARCFALFMEMGTGKTKVGIDTAAYLFSEGEIDTLMITAPNGVHRQWIREQIPEHLPDWVKRRSCAYQSSQTQKFRKELEHTLAAPEDELCIVSFHVDAFSTELGVKTAEKILTTRRVLWIVDESTRIKSPKAERTKRIIALGALAQYRRIMSGAPITQGVEDLYTQFRFLNHNILGHNTFTTFRNQYCLTRPIPRAAYGAVKIIGYQNLDLLKEKIEPYSFRVTKAECLDLPPKTYMRHEVELTAEQKRLYKDMKNELLAQLDDGTVITAPIAAVALMKLQQIICGHVRPDPDGKYVRIDSNRVEAAMDLIELAQGKVIVWCRFTADVELLIEALGKRGIDYVEYTGRISNDDRTLAIEKFRNDPACKVFLANPQAGGTGLNLAVASTAIYYSNDFNADTRWQSEDRIHRIGQDKNAVYIDIVAPGTIDAGILAALKKKKNVADNVLDVKELLEGQENEQDN